MGVLTDPEAGLEAFARSFKSTRCWYFGRRSDSVDISEADANRINDQNWKEAK